MSDALSPKSLANWAWRARNAQPRRQPVMLAAAHGRLVSAVFGGRPHLTGRDLIDRTASLRVRRKRGLDGPVTYLRPGWATQIAPLGDRDVT